MVVVFLGGGEEYCGSRSRDFKDGSFQSCNFLGYLDSMVEGCGIVKDFSGHDILVYYYF